jgi:ribosomal protein RSM22 (predicted rRNA methylase)
VRKTGLAPGCALAESNWCHFGSRVARTRLHRQVKGGELGFEDEKYSYVTLAREPVTASPRSPGTRPLRRARTAQDLRRGGVAERIVSKRDDEAYKWVQHARWGDRVPPPLCAADR